MSESLLDEDSTTERLREGVVNRTSSPKFRRMEARRFAIFFLTGGVAALCNVAARALLSRFVVYGAAVAIAYLIGMLVAFLLAKAFVFDPNPRRWHLQLMRFGLVNVVSFAQVWVVSVGLEHFVLLRMGWKWHPELCAHVLGVASPILGSYFAHKHFTFGRIMDRTG